MTIHENENPSDATYRCPICGSSLSSEPALPQYDAPCSQCGYFLWCRERCSAGVVALDVLPQRTPKPWDIVRLVEALVARGAHVRVVADLSRLDLVDSAFIARLMSLNKLLQASAGRLALTGLCAHIRETFGYLRLDRAFEIVESAGSGD